MMGIRRAVLMATDPDLPPGYRRVDYIRSESSAFIQTDYVPVRYDEIESEFTIDTNSLRCLFSAGMGTYQLVFLTQSGSNSYTYLRYFDSSAPSYKFSLQEGAWNSLRLSGNGVLTINGVSNSYTYKSAIDGTNGNMYVFIRSNKQSAFIGKLRKFKITNSGTLKLNLIPCIRGSDGKAGVYDTVSKTFYGSASAYDEFIPSTADS